MENKKKPSANKSAQGVPDEAAMKKQMTVFEANYNKFNLELHNGEQMVVSDFKDQHITSQPNNAAAVGGAYNLMESYNGVLAKYSPSWFSSWQERFFVLHNKKIKWFIKEADTVPQGVINFDFFKCVVEAVPNDKRCFNLTLLGSDRVFNFKANSEQECLEWQNKL